VSRRGLSIVIVSVMAALVALAATWPRFHPDSTLQPASTVTPGDLASGAAPGNSNGSGNGNDSDNGTPSLITGLTALLHDGNSLSWSRLTDAQRAALAPFATRWNTFSAVRKRRWLRIAARYPRLSPQAQQHLHDQMTAWINMTPEQRRIARENYQISKRLPPQARQNAWATYLQLPADLKQKFAASGHKHRPTVISSPPTSGANDINRLVGRDSHGLMPPTPVPSSSSPAPSAAARPASQPAGAAPLH
jgi:hypothetical protein